MNVKEIQKESVAKTAGALASGTRMNIIRLLMGNPLSVTEIAEQLHMPVSSAISAVLKLESSGLITSVTRGSKKICFVDYEALLFHLSNFNISNDHGGETVFLSIPIGSYCDFSVTPSCGLLNDNAFIGSIDSTASFLSQDKIFARLIWIRKGFLEYRFPNPVPRGKKVRSISISMEICAEYPGYNNDFPSDIKLSINDVDVGVYHSEGDFGGRKGVFTPECWAESSTQYGKLATWAITCGGSYIDARSCSGVTVDQLGLSDGVFITFRISVDENGGLNLFSKDFGDYYQDIEVRMDLCNIDE